MLNEKKAEAFKDSMIFEAYNAWQQLSTKGVLKKDTSFEKYKSQLGLGDAKSSKIDKREKEEVIKTASFIHETLQRAQNGKQKNI